MPRAPYTAEFLVGYIFAKMEQIRGMVHRLDNRDNFTASELTAMRMDLEEAALDISVQSRMVSDQRIQPKLKEFGTLVSMTTDLIDSHEREAAHVRRRNSPIRFGEVDMSAMCGEGQSTTPRRSRPQRIVPLNSAELDDFASTNGRPLPLERMSVIKPARGYRPVEFRPTSNGSNGSANRGQEDLRERLQRRRSPEPTRNRNSPERIRERRQEPSRQQRPSNGHDSSSGPPSVAGSRRSRSSYVSTQQEIFRTPQRSGAFPDVQTTMPFSIVREDPANVGRSEIWVHPPQPASICAHCAGAHKMFRCPEFLDEKRSLQDRWFDALRSGACLNCLLRGHSSFTCKSVGACKRCGQRHNSVLCPKNPDNYPSANRKRAN